jgi:hypothetical protein
MIKQEKYHTLAYQALALMLLAAVMLGSLPAMVGIAAAADIDAPPLESEILVNAQPPEPSDLVTQSSMEEGTPTTSPADVPVDQPPQEARMQSIEPETPPLCQAVVVSDTLTTVVEKSGAGAKTLSFLHPAWTASTLFSSLSRWIWGDDPVTSPTNVTETQTFVRTFGWQGTVATATLRVAADNGYRVELNATPVGMDLGEFNYRADGVDTYVVTNQIQSGNNTLRFEVTNMAASADPKENPAGLRYELTIEGVGNDCGLIPFEEPTVPIKNTCLLPASKKNESSFTLGTGEIALQAIFNSFGYGSVDALDDQLNTTRWNLEDNDTASVTLTARVLGKYAAHNQAFGYYLAGSSTTFVPLFKVGAHSAAVPAIGTGDSLQFTIPASGVDGVGFALSTQGDPTTTWHSEPALNLNGEDNLAVYNPSDNTYLLAFEDKPAAGSDNDHNDLVVEITKVSCEQEDIPEVPTTGTVTGTKWHDYNKNAQRDEGEPTLSGWTIVATMGTTSTTTVTDVLGNYSFTLPVGMWTISEVPKVGWIQTGVRLYGVPQPGTMTCAVSVGGATPAVTSESGTQCDFGNDEVDVSSDPQETITVCKYDDEERVVSGWVMTIANAKSSSTAVTGQNGCVSFTVNPDEGPWRVTEEMKTGWTFASHDAEMGVEGVNDAGVPFCEFFGRYEARGQATYADEGSPRCSFFNNRPVIVDPDPEDPIVNPPSDNNRRSGGSSTRVTRAAPVGIVAGAATTTAPMCPFLLDHMQAAWDNDPFEVTKLQLFLNMFVGTTSVTGVFDAATVVRVKEFQEQYRSEILEPWYQRGIVPHNRPTGFVYKTTRWKINDIICPGFEPYPSFDGESLTKNVVIR